jgi:hypothetical protein
VAGDNILFVPPQSAFRSFIDVESAGYVVTVMFFSALKVQNEELAVSLKTTCELSMLGIWYVKLVSLFDITAPLAVQAYDRPSPDTDEVMLALLFLHATGEALMVLMAGGFFTETVHTLLITVAHLAVTTQR